MKSYIKTITALSFFLVFPHLFGQSVYSKTTNNKITLEVNEIYAAVSPKTTIKPSQRPVAKATIKPVLPKVSPKPIPTKTPEIKLTPSTMPSITPNPIVAITPTATPTPKEERNPDEVDVFTFKYINKLEAELSFLKIIITSDCSKSPDNCNSQEKLDTVTKKIYNEIKIKYPLFNDFSEEQIKSTLINSLTIKDRLGEQNYLKIAKIEEDLKLINESVFKDKKDEIIKMVINTKPSITPQLIPTPEVSETPNPFLNGRIVFVSERDENPEIYLMSPDGSNQKRITDNPAFDTMPSFSPDGSKIVFVSDRDNNPEIYIMNVDGTNLTRLTTNSAYDYSPHWSPDGSKIIFVSNRGDSSVTGGAVSRISFKIFVMNVDGSNQTKISESSFDDEAPKWSPDGTKIVFVSKRDGNPEIYTINSDGAELLRLTNSPTFDIMPTWSSDGSKIAFRSDRDGNPEVYTMNSDGAELLRVTKNLSSDESPAWSPDGTKLLFVSRRDNIRDSSEDFVNEIYKMNSDSSNIVRLTNNQFNDYSPSWSKN